MYRDLETLRRKIDEVNLELLNLLNRRTLMIKDIGELKDLAGLDYFDPQRETEMMERIIENNRGPLCNELVKDVFKAVFTASLKYMGIKREKKLLVSSQYDTGFLSVRDMFQLREGEPLIIAGPCAIEKLDYLESIAGLLNECGIRFLRGGAYKPRTSPYDFQGLKREGLEMLHDVGKRYRLLTVTEVVDTRDVEMVSGLVDILQVGARNMQNFELLKEVGQVKKPVLLKRGISATMEELILAAEYIGLQGNRQIILCERGIRTYETKTRNTLDISAIPILKKETNLPVLADLSHSLGRKDIVNPVTKAVLAAGADGFMVEVHPYPEVALSDSKQQLNPQEFKALLRFIGIIKETEVLA